MLNSYKFFIINASIIVGVIALVKLASHCTSVKINNATDEAIVLSLSNDSFADEFESLNKPNIQTKLRWWQS